MMYLYAFLLFVSGVARLGCLPALRFLAQELTALMGFERRVVAFPSM